MEAIADTEPHDVSFENVLSKTREGFGFKTTQELRENIFQENVLLTLKNHLIQEVGGSTLKESHTYLRREISKTFYERLAFNIQRVIFQRLSSDPEIGQQIKRYDRMLYRVWNGVKSIFGWSDWQIAAKKVTKSMQNLADDINKSLDGDQEYQNILKRVGDWKWTPEQIDGKVKQFVKTRFSESFWGESVEFEDRLLTTLFCKICCRNKELSLSFPITIDEIKSVRASVSGDIMKLLVVSTWRDFALRFSKAEVEGYGKLYKDYMGLLLKAFVIHFHNEFSRVLFDNIQPSKQLLEQYFESIIEKNPEIDLDELKRLIDTNHPFVSEPVRNSPAA